MTVASADRRVQRFDALGRANEVRLRRAEIKRWIRATDARTSVRRAIEVLEEREQAVSSWPVGEFLATPRRFGETRARKILVRLQIGESKALGSLTDRQVRLIVARLVPSAAPRSSPSGPSSGP